MLLTNWLGRLGAHLDAKTIDDSWDALYRVRQWVVRAMIFRVGMTITPILLGVFILTQGSEASHFIMAAIAIVGGLLGGAFFWWDVQKARRQ